MDMDMEKGAHHLPTPFLSKTYELVDDPATDHIVSWSEDETTFVVWRPPEFAGDLLPKYFKHNNFSSFVRQLNTYGFHKVVPERWEFGNENFRKGAKHLLGHIHRRKPSTNDPSPLPMTPFSSNANNALSALLNENRLLRQDKAALLFEISRLHRLCNETRLLFNLHVPVVQCNPTTFSSSPKEAEASSSTSTSSYEKNSNMPDIGSMDNSSSCPKLFGVALRFTQPSAPPPPLYKLGKTNNYSQHPS